MKEISLHVLDLIENSAAAGAARVEVTIEEDAAGDRLRVTVADDGQGMAPEIASTVADPFTTTRTTRSVGLGLALLAGAAEQAGGSLSVKSEQGQGTTIAAEFELSSIDRAPLGRIEDTLAAAALVHPELEVGFTHRGPGGCYQLDLKALSANSSQGHLRDEISRLVREGRERIGSVA
jgi:anti-sigma regulatory factor (Ser/Thr protein kinase)